MTSTRSLILYEKIRNEIITLVLSRSFVFLILTTWYKTREELSALSAWHVFLTLASAYAWSWLELLWSRDRSLSLIIPFFFLVSQCKYGHSIIGTVAVTWSKFAPDCFNGTTSKINNCHLRSTILKAKILSLSPFLFLSSLSLYSLSIHFWRRPYAQNVKYFFTLSWTWK